MDEGHGDGSFVPLCQKGRDTGTGVLSHYARKYQPGRIDQSRSVLSFFILFRPSAWLSACTIRLKMASVVKSFAIVGVDAHLVEVETKTIYG